MIGKVSRRYAMIALLAIVVFESGCAHWSTEKGDQIANDRDVLHSELLRLKALAEKNRESVMDGVAELDTSFSKDISMIQVETANLKQRIDALERNLANQLASNTPGMDLKAEDELFVKLKARVDAVEKAVLARGGVLSPKYGWKGGEDPLAYNQARTEHTKKNFSEAIAKFQEFIRVYPLSDYMDRVQFWLGESLFESSRYQDAIAAYGTVIEKFPESSNAPAAAYKTGESFAKIGNCGDARSFYGLVTSKYASSPLASEARRKANSCR